MFPNLNIGSKISIYYWSISTKEFLLFDNQTKLSELISTEKIDSQVWLLCFIGSKPTNKNITKRKFSHSWKIKKEWQIIHDNKLTSFGSPAAGEDLGKVTQIVITTLGLEVPFLDLGHSCFRKRKAETAFNLTSYSLAMSITEFKLNNRQNANHNGRGAEWRGRLGQGGLGK